MRPRCRVCLQAIHPGDHVVFKRRRLDAAVHLACLEAYVEEAEPAGRPHGRPPRSARVA